MNVDTIGDLVAALLEADDTDKPVVMMVKTKPDTYFYGDADPIEHWEKIYIDQVQLTGDGAKIWARR